MKPQFSREEMSGMSPIIDDFIAASIWRSR